MLNFDYETVPARVIFGNGRLAEIRAETEALGAKRALVLSGKQQVDLAQKTSEFLSDRCVGLHAGAAAHVPYPTVRSALDEVNRLKVDLLVAPGGGSTIGLAKGIARESKLPILAIPTTYAGSEMTRIWGISRDGRKTTGRDAAVKPKTVIYDPELLLTLPAAASLTSGLNAMAHAAEALYAKEVDPVAKLLAEESIRQLSRSLPDVVNDPQEIEARTNSLYGAWLAALVLDRVGMALHHKLCHTLGGSFNMPHAPTHTVILPYVVSYNAPAIPEALSAMSRALACAPHDVPGTIQDISRENGGPISLQELGLKQEQLKPAAQLATRSPYFNPRPVDTTSILTLLQQAYTGQRP